MTKAQVLLSKILRGVKFTKTVVNSNSIKFRDVKELKEIGAYNKIVDWTIVYHVVADKFQEMLNDERDFKRLSKKQADEIAVEIDSYLKSIPLTYHFIFEMPKGLSAKKIYNISSEIKIKKFTKKEVEAYKKSNEIADAYDNGILEALNDRKTQFKTPEIDKSYMVIKSTGFIHRFKTILLSDDPLYIYKCLISLCVVSELMILHKWHDVDTYSNEDTLRIYAFDDYKNFITSVTRPQDEEKYIADLSFNEEVNIGEIENLFNHMSILVSKQKKKLNEEFRNQLLNSLYWYFEVSKTNSVNLKTVFFTTIFDSFFKADDKSYIKAKIISTITGASLSEQRNINSTLEKLYVDRNKIIHGEVPLFDYHHSSVESSLTARVNHKTLYPKIYYDYFSHQIEKFKKSI